MLYTYVNTPNDNLLCCICRAPFTEPLTTRTCSHTFCRECIVTALSVAHQCPIDRSPLSLNDLTPADPLVRNLVDELEVECPNSSDGCTHTCQRQLLTSHLADDCPFEMVPCSVPTCGKMVHRKDREHQTHASREACIKCGEEISEADRETHNKICNDGKTSCEACGKLVPSATFKAHEDQCDDVVISCAHASNGCPWKGPRYQAKPHIDICPYEAIKGFFAVHESKVSSLQTENLVLRSRLAAFDGLVNSLRRELDIARAALGPWYRPESINRHTLASSATPDTASTSRHPSQELDSVYMPQELRPNSPPQSGDPADIASYFPPLEDDGGDAHAGYHVTDYQLPSYVPSSPPASAVASSSQQPMPSARLPGPATFYSPYGQIPPIAQAQPIQTPPQAPQTTTVAPLNLSTTLEGALTGLRESIVAVAASVDSLGRRQEVSAMTEAMRTTEEIRSLRAVVHGLRMQVHAIMMDHNAQVTGRSGDPSSSSGIWPPPDAQLPMRDPALVGPPPPWYGPRHPHPHPGIAPAPPITKL